MLHQQRCKKIKDCYSKASTAGPRNDSVIIFRDDYSSNSTWHERPEKHQAWFKPMEKPGMQNGDCSPWTILHLNILFLPIYPKH